MFTIVTCTNRPQYMKNILQNFQQQNIEQKELIIVLNTDDHDIEEWIKLENSIEKISVFQLPSNFTLGECLNFAIERARYSYIAKFDDDDFYSPYYLMEALHCFKSTGADLIGKRSFFCYFEQTKSLVLRSPAQQNKYTNHVAGATLVFNKEAWEKVKFTKKNIKEDVTFIKDLVNHGYKIYSSSKYNFTCIRKSDPTHHTWIFSEKDFLKSCEFIATTDNFKPYVTKRGPLEGS